MQENSGFFNLLPIDLIAGIYKLLRDYRTQKAILCLNHELSASLEKILFFEKIQSDYFFSGWTLLEKLSQHQRAYIEQEKNSEQQSIAAKWYHRTFNSSYYHSLETDDGQKQFFLTYRPAIFKPILSLFLGYRSISHFIADTCKLMTSDSSSSHNRKLAAHYFQLNSKLYSEGLCSLYSSEHLNRFNTLMTIVESEPNTFDAIRKQLITLNKENPEAARFVIDYLEAAKATESFLATLTLVNLLHFPMMFAGNINLDVIHALVSQLTDETFFMLASHEVSSSQLQLKQQLITFILNQHDLIKNMRDQTIIALLLNDLSFIAYENIFETLNSLGRLTSSFLVRLARAYGCLQFFISSLPIVQQILSNDLNALVKILSLPDAEIYYHPLNDIFFNHEELTVDLLVYLAKKNFEIFINQIDQRIKQLLENDLEILSQLINIKPDYKLVQILLAHSTPSALLNLIREKILNMDFMRDHSCSIIEFMLKDIESTFELLKIDTTNQKPFLLYHLYGDNLKKIGDNQYAYLMELRVKYLCQNTNLPFSTLNDHDRTALVNYFESIVASSNDEPAFFFPEHLTPCLLVQLVEKKILNMRFIGRYPQAITMFMKHDLDSAFLLAMMDAKCKYPYLIYHNIFITEILIPLQNTHEDRYRIYFETRGQFLFNEAKKGIRFSGENDRLFLEYYFETRAENDDGSFIDEMLTTFSIQDLTKLISEYTALFEHLKKTVPKSTFSHTQISSLWSYSILLPYHDSECERLTAWIEFLDAVFHANIQEPIRSKLQQERFYKFFEDLFKCSQNAFAFHSLQNLLSKSSVKTYFLTFKKENPTLVPDYDFDESMSNTDSDLSEKKIDNVSEINETDPDLSEKESNNAHFEKKDREPTPYKHRTEEAEDFIALNSPVSNIFLTWNQKYVIATYAIYSVLTSTIAILGIFNVPFAIDFIKFLLSFLPECTVESAALFILCSSILLPIAITGMMYLKNYFCSESNLKNLKSDNPKEMDYTIKLINSTNPHEPLLTTSSHNSKNESPNNKLPCTNVKNSK